MLLHDSFLFQCQVGDAEYLDLSVFSRSPIEIAFSVLALADPDVPPLCVVLFALNWWSSIVLFILKMGITRRKSAAEKKDLKAVKKESPKKVVKTRDKSKTPATSNQHEEGNSGLGRVLFRRDTEHQIDRCTRLKLGMYPRQQVENNVNAAG